MCEKVVMEGECVVGVKNIMFVMVKECVCGVNEI